VSTRLLPNLPKPSSSLLSKKKSQDLLAVRRLLATSTHVRWTLSRNARLVRGLALTVIAPRRSWMTRDGSTDRSDDPTCVPIVVSRHDPNFRLGEAKTEATPCVSCACNSSPLPGRDGQEQGSHPAALPGRRFARFDVFGRRSSSRIDESRCTHPFARRAPT
jgi:hypothetical protein